MRTVDHEAQLAAKNDAKFLANLTGSSWRVKTGSVSRCGSPAGTLPSPSAAQKQSPAKASSAAAAAPRAATSSASQPARSRQLASAPALQNQQQGSACTTPQQHGAADAAYDLDSSAGRHDNDLSVSPKNTHDDIHQASSLQQQQQGQQLQPQQLPASPLGNRAARESPQWLLHTAKQGPGSAGPRAMHGPVHAEISLYASWAASQQLDRPAAVSSNTLLTRSQPCSPTPALVPAAGAPSHGRRADQVPHRAGAELSSPAGLAGSCRSASAGNQPMTLTAQAAEAAADTAAAAAALLPGSPCSSNFHNTRAAGIAAGISRAGAVSPEHRDWFKQQHPRALPPRREDTQQLWQWLADELQQLKRQLLQPSTQQQQAQGQLAPPQQQQQQQQCKEKQTQQPQQQTQSSGAAGEQPAAGTCRPRARTAAAAAASTASAGPSSAGTSSCSRSTSPVPRLRSTSPGRTLASADGCMLSSTPAALEQQVQVLTQLCRGADGMLQAEYVQLQQDLFAAAFQEVCRQVSVGCLERGALMTQLWSAHDLLLQAALQDRLVLQQQCTAAVAAIAAAAQEQQRLRQLAEDERVALQAINERHAARADAARQDYEQLKLQNDNLQELLKRLSGAQQLVQRVMDLESSGQQQELALQQLRLQLAARDEQLEATSAQLLQWQARAQAAEQQVVQQAQQLGCSTPRPKRDLGLLCDLVEPLHQQLIERALVAGLPAHHVHRLLLGLSNTGQDLRPWLPLAGACVSALQAASDPLLLHQLLKQHLAECNAAALSKHLSTPDHLQLLSQAVHVGMDVDTLISLLDGSLGLPPPPQAASAVCSNTATASQQQQQQQMRASVAAGAGAASTGAAAAASSVGLGMQFLPLVGVLASKYGHNAREMGGPVTEALAQAQLSTVARVQDMEARCRAMHREVVMLKCTLAEQRKQEQERVEAALKDQKRKFARREARQPTPLEKFLQTKWGTTFTGIGMSADIPRALRSTVPVNNKQMSKREAEKLASEIWAFKDEHEAATGCIISLPEATAVFLERRFFAIPRLVIEVAYNLVYSLGQHTYDTDCNLFLRVFSGEVDESVRHEQQLLEGEIMRLLKLLDMSINHQATGWLHKVDVKTALAGFFKGKKVDRLAEVLEALDTDEPGDALHYSCLFSDDENLSQGLTAEIIRSQHLTERLEFLQEIEDVIRDAAEDNGTTSLTPAMLEACLRKTHKRLDSAAVSECTARAFGADWENQRHRLAQPLGAIIRAMRLGGLPNMVRPAAGPSNMAGAVNRIVPVGKFKNKLVSALKVGFGKDASTGAAAATGQAAAAAAAPKGVRSRRATQEAVSAAIAAVLSGDGSNARAKHKQAAQAAAGGAIDGFDVPERPASARDAVPDAAGAGPEDVQQGQQQGFDHQDGGSQPSTARDGSNSRSMSAGSVRHLQVLVPSDPAAAFDLLSPASRSGKSTAPVTPSAAAAAATRPSTMGGARNSAVARALTVDVLSAMEAVRQSWLKEEGDRIVSFSNSGMQLSAAGAPSAAAGGASEGSSAWLQQQALSSGSGLATAGTAAAVDHQGMLRLDYVGPAAAAAPSTGTPRSAYTSSSGSSKQYAMPAVPALRLSDVLPIAEPTGSFASAGSNSVGDTYRSTTSYMPCSGRGSSCEGSSTAGSTAGGTAGGGAAGLNGNEAPNSSRALMQQHSMKPILLSGQESHKPAKHVQINTEDTVFAFRPTNNASAAESPSMPQQQQQQQQPAATAGLFSPSSLQPGRQLPVASGWGSQQDGVPAADQATAAAAVPGIAAANASTVGTAAAGAPAASRSVSRSSSTSRQLEHSRSKTSLKGGSGSTTPRGTKLQSAGAESSSAPAAQTAPAVKRRSSRSALLAAQLPQLLLTDADDACAAEASTPAGADAEHSHVCFTPQAPEEGGKRNAILMRRLNKGKSLKQLEEVMLAVAGGEFELD